MGSRRFSPEYRELYKRGPFPGQIDPWAETGRYFHQIHGGMIDELQDMLQDTLIEMGYQVGREASLQIVTTRQPDLYVERVEHPKTLQTRWDYETAASEILMEPGTAILEYEPELSALYVYDITAGDLVTVIEIISPSNKVNPNDIARYQTERKQLFLAQGVNVVEIDATRSYKRLITHVLTQDHAYHIAIFLPGDLPRVLVNDYGEPLKRFALPLREEVVPVDTQAAYDRAYQSGAVGGLIYKEGQYIEDALPFPSLLTEAQQQEALAAVKAWQDELARLREGQH